MGAAWTHVDRHVAVHVEFGTGTCGGGCEDVEGGDVAVAVVAAVVLMREMGERHIIACAVRARDIRMRHEMKSHSLKISRAPRGFHPRGQSAATRKMRPLM